MTASLAHLMLVHSGLLTCWWVDRLVARLQKRRNLSSKFIFCADIWNWLIWSLRRGPDQLVNWFAEDDTESDCCYFQCTRSSFLFSSISSSFHASRTVMLTWSFRWYRITSRNVGVPFGTYTAWLWPAATCTEPDHWVSKPGTER